MQYDGWKLIVGRVAGANGRPDAIQLYDLQADPGALDDIAEVAPGWVRRLQAMPDEYRQTNRPPGPRPVEAVFDPAVLGDLQRLGSLGGRQVGEFCLTGPRHRLPVVIRKIFCLECQNIV